MLGCFSQGSVAFGYGLRCLTGIGTNHCLIEASRTLGTRLLFVASRLLEEPNSNEALAQFEGQACPSVTYAIAYWPAAGFVDTEIRCLTELESWNAEKEVQPRVQA